MEASASDDATVDIRWPLSPSRARPAALLQLWPWQRTGQPGGDF
jgi:hypothetical protein